MVKLNWKMALKEETGGKEGNRGRWDEITVGWDR